MAARRLVVACIGSLALALAVGEVAPAGTDRRTEANPSALLAGIPQHGLWLGRPGAKLVLVEYVDLQCPFCARFSREVFPQVVRRYVRTGRVQVLFRGLAFVGPDSVVGLRWVLAAGHQNSLWNVLEVLYARQGAENSGWITRTRLISAARAVPGLRVDRLRRESTSAGVTAEIRAAANAAHAARVPGTPYFEAGRSLIQLAPLRLTSFDANDFSAQLDALLRR